ncbi:glutathione S-transferase family protein [Hyphomicrobium sp. xq]|uniref:Glutathione S-transferase family protein n=1 Tax=Hyphomicrobium album TaxID=2665159 RepID=A0A6I3KNH5_9HYPH|nr:glutathione S-transferase family protein [Hyphomicrobium album]
MQLYAHPFSSYCQKVLIALYENDTPFEFRMLAPDEKRNLVEFAKLSPMRRMPVLVDGERAVVESSVIVEYLDVHHPGRERFVPQEADAALEVRGMDRMFDNYVMTPMQRIVFDFIRAPEVRDPKGVEEAGAMLDRAYAWLDGAIATRTWAAGETFSLADCAAAPSLFYADWVHPIPEGLANLRAYRARLLARPSYARAVDDARPYREMFPPGAPDRD